MRLIKTDARFRRPPQQPRPLSRVGYHVDRRCHLSLAAFDSTMSCRMHPVQYRVNRWLGSPVCRRPKTANGSATGAPVSWGQKKPFPRTYTIPRNIPRQGNLDENRTKQSLRSHLFQPELPSIEARSHEPSAIKPPHLPGT